MLGRVYRCRLRLKRGGRFPLLANIKGRAAAVEEGGGCGGTRGQASHAATNLRHSQDFPTSVGAEISQQWLWIRVESWGRLTQASKSSASREGFTYGVSEGWWLAGHWVTDYICKDPREEFQSHKLGILQRSSALAVWTGGSSLCDITKGKYYAPVHHQQTADWPRGNCDLHKDRTENITEHLFFL